MWTAVIAELQDGSDDGAVDQLVWGPDMLEPPGEYDTPKSVRDRNFATRDPVHTVNALEFVKARLRDLVARAGGEAVFEADFAVNVDADVRESFWAMVRAPRQVRPGSKTGNPNWVPKTGTQDGIPRRGTQDGNPRREPQTGTQAGNLRCVSKVRYLGRDGNMDMLSAPFGGGRPT